MNDKCLTFDERELHCFDYHLDSVFHFNKWRFTLILSDLQIFISSWNFFVNCVWFNLFEEGQTMTSLLQTLSRQLLSPKSRFLMCQSNRGAKLRARRLEIGPNRFVAYRQVPGQRQPTIVFGEN